MARTPDQFWSKSHIRVWVGHEVLGIDPVNQRIDVVDSDGHHRREPYDQLLIATGSLPIWPEIDNIRSAGVFSVKTLSDGEAIRAWIEEQRPKRALVAGGGYIGLEMADNLAHWGIPVTLIEQGKQLMASMDEEMARDLEPALQGLGVDVRLETRLEAVRSERGQVTGVIAGGQAIRADLLVLGLGVRPNSALARDAGLALGVQGALTVGPDMRTLTPHVWAAGDVVESFHRVSQRPVYMPLATVANKQGRIAGLNLAGGQEQFPGVVGTAITRVGGREVARTGLSTREAEEAGLSVVSQVIDTETKLSYFPDVAPIRVKLIAEAGTGRLLGGQISGGQGSAIRIDTLATALHYGMSVNDLLDLDLAYAPPFSDVWDPVQVAARVIGSKI